MVEERNWANQENKILKKVFYIRRKLFEAGEEQEKRKESEKKKKQNEKLIKDKIIGDIRSLFEEEDYYEPKRANSFWNNNYIEY